jgi:hypothetical protein
LRRKANPYARRGRETEFWRSSLAQNPGDLAGGNPEDLGNLGNRHAVLHQGADTTTSHGRLMLTVLGGLAEFERDLIRARTGEGRERAKARGVKMGRKPKLTPHQQAEAIKRREAGEPIREIARGVIRVMQIS